MRVSYNFQVTKWKSATNLHVYLRHAEEHEIDTQTLLVYRDMQLHKKCR